MAKRPRYSGVSDIHSESERIHDFGHELNLNQKAKPHKDGADPGKQYQTGMGEHLEGYGHNVDEGKQDELVGFECEHEHDHLMGNPEGHFHYIDMSDEEIEDGYKALGSHNTADDKAQTYDSDGLSQGEIGGKHEKNEYEESDRLD